MDPEKKNTLFSLLNMESPKVQKVSHWLSKGEVSCDRVLRYSGFFGVRSEGPVGDFLDKLFNLGNPSAYIISSWCFFNPFEK